MLQKIASPRLEPVVFLEKTTDLPKWREAVTRVAEGALGPAWRTTIKVEGRLSAELEGLNPDHSAIKKMKAGMPPVPGPALPAPPLPSRTEFKLPAPTSLKGVTNSTCDIEVFMGSQIFQSYPMTWKIFTP